MSTDEGQGELGVRLAREREVRSELERTSRLKDEFLATLARELRAPLNAILGWSRLIEHGKLTSEDAQRGGQTITRNVRALAQVVDDLSDVSAMLSGTIQIQPEETDLGEVVEAVLETLQGAAEEKGVLLRKALPSTACLVFGDPHRLQQIIRNLLSNAVKFTPRGGTVSASLERSNGDWEVRISDTGVGIARELVPVVFERFRHAAKAEQPGLGLGLAIVKQLAELHGGRAWATSEGEGQGATFHVCLPRLAPRELAGESAAEAPRSGVDLQGVRVLVIDDEAATLEAARQVLGGRRAIVVTAASVDAGLASLTSFAADVLVCDPSLPGGDGAALLGALRAARGGGEQPAVALTPFARPEDAVRAREAGFQMHLPKPLEPEELLRIVAQLAGRS